MPDPVLPKPKSPIRRIAGQPVSAAAGLVKGFNCSVHGFRLAFAKGMKRWTLAPVALNVMLYGAAAWGFMHGVEWVVQASVGDVDRWYDYLLLVFVGVGAIVLFGLLCFFTFVLAVSILTAPFADVLSEKTEAALTGKKLDGAFTVGRFVKDILRGIAHAVKLLLMQLVVLVVGLFPIVGPPLAIAGTAILLALEFMDHPMARRRMAFREKRRLTFAARWHSLGFGLGAMLWLIVPGINLVCVPAAVCGATALYLEIAGDDARTLTNSAKLSNPAKPGAGN